jgi:2,3-bisphosphoglycerate-independent phosphoglycerate mutase
MSRALNYTDFPHFDRGIILENLYFATMTRYEAEFPFPVLFPKETLKNVLGEIVSSAGLKQFRIAETEKYAHVTYFLNGGEEKVFAGEERQLVPSPKVATYDLQPEMSADLVTEHLVKTMENKTDIAMYVVNYANCDMVGHTGIMDAAVKAVETVDRNLQKIVETFFATGGDYVLVTADHGNAEQMVDYETGEAFTEHTLNEVPLVLLSRVKGKNLKKQGALCDLAPTMLTLMELEIPKEMTGQSLLV